MRRNLLTSVHVLGLFSLYLGIYAGGNPPARDEPDLIPEEPAIRRMVRAANQRFNSEGHQPVLIFCDWGFTGSGTLVRKNGREYIVTARHVVEDAKDAVFTYLVLRPRKDESGWIQFIARSTDPITDIAIGFPGPRVRFENLSPRSTLPLHQLEIIPSEPAWYTSVLTGRRFQSKFSTRLSAGGVVATHPLICCPKIIGQGESGAGFVDDDGNLYVLCKRALINEDSLRLLKSAGVLRNEKREWALILMRFDAQIFRLSP